LDVNSYEVIATFDGGKNFNTSSDKDSFEISPKASSVTFVNLVNNYIYSNNVVVNVKSDVAGTVTVKVGDKTQTKQITAKQSLCMLVCRTIMMFLSKFRTKLAEISIRSNILSYFFSLCLQNSTK
jgi:hypothetical protein